MTGKEEESDDEDQEGQGVGAGGGAESKKDSYERHWSAETKLVEGKTKEELSEPKWKKKKGKIVGLGQVVEFEVEGTEQEEEEGNDIVRFCEC